MLVFSLITAGLRALKTICGKPFSKRRGCGCHRAAERRVDDAGAAYCGGGDPGVYGADQCDHPHCDGGRKADLHVVWHHVQKSAAGAKALNKQKDAIDGVGEAAKEASKYLAGFDELNVMDSQDNSSASGSGGFDTSGGIAPDFTSMIDDSLSAILELFTGTALLALGAVLTFSGANIPLGIALMVLGAIAIWDAISENWDAIKEMLQGPLGWAVSILSVAALVIGAILIFSGANIPLGLGLLIMGAIGLASAVAANWNYIVEALQGPLGLVVGLLGAALLVLGIVLLFTGVGVPLGLGLILIGATGLAAAIAPNWNFLKEKLVGCWESIKTGGTQR